jgi:hypothetical protein
VIKLEQTLGLLDAAFANLSILYTTDEEKKELERLLKHYQSIGDKWG